ncbi:MAG: hypothetical protein Q9166_005555 [cf. Caloplaca sp. 2 TL-2023]
MDLDQHRDESTCYFKSRLYTESESLRSNTDEEIDLDDRPYTKNSAPRAHPTELGAASQAASQQLNEDVAGIRGGHLRSATYIEQEKYSGVTRKEMTNTGSKPCSPERMPKRPLADQEIAFKAALQQPNAFSAGIRSGELRNAPYTDQENYFKATGTRCHLDVGAPPLQRTPKVPLAEQGIAFRADLEHSNRVSPIVRERASRNREPNDDIQIKGAAAAAEQQRTIAQERQRKKNAKKRQKTKQHQSISEHYPR